MKQFLRLITLPLLIGTLLLTGTSCRGSSSDKKPNDTAEQTNSRTEGPATDAPTDGSETTTTTPPPRPDESAILSSAAEAWDLSDGGTGGTIKTANGGTDATHRWGVWLKNKTFGYALDFSTEGSHALVKDSKFTIGDNFTLSAWVKAPVRDGGDRVILSQGLPSSYHYDDILSFDRMESKTRWSSTGDLKVISEQAPEGEGYFQTSRSEAGTLLITKPVRPLMDISSYEDGGYLHLWMCIEGLENVKEGQIEFTSSGESDKNELQFNAVCVSENGVWTEVYLPFSNSSRGGGEVDMTAINYFRLYINTTGPVTLKIDDVYFCKRVAEPVTGGWQMLINKAGELDFTAAGMEGLASSGCKIDDGLWHHTLVSLANGTLSYAVDGQVVKTLSVSGTPTAAGRDLYIGSTADYTRHLDGSLAELRLFDEARLPGEVTVTILDPADNEAQRPVMDMKQGIVPDRRQYYGSDSRELEPGAVVGYEDIAAMKNMGFDHVKLLLTPNHLIAEDGSLKKEEMEYITWVVNNVIEQDFRAMICIHPESPFKETYLATLDKFELLCKWYGELAAYIGEHWASDEVSLQLMTEPFANSSEVTWSYMSDRMWGAVRNVLPDHTIITSSVMGNLESLKTMSPATDDNLIYSFTTYEPYTTGFATFVSSSTPMWKYIKNVPYPIKAGVDYTLVIESCIEEVPNEYKANARELLTNYVKGVSDNGHVYVNNYDSLYNAEWHMLRAKSLDDWRQKYGGNIHIMCVEFGCMYPEWPMAVYGAKVLGISHESRYQLIKDLRTSFEAYDIGWSYWSYNEAFTIFEPAYALALRGEFPNAATIAKVVDYRLLKDSLGVTPKVDYTAPAYLCDAVGAWKLNDATGKTAASELPLGQSGRYVGVSSEAYGDGQAAVFDGKGYMIAENTGLDLGAAFTISANIKTSISGKAQTILSQMEDMDEIYIIDSFDTVAGMWGTTAVTQGTLTEAAEGTGYAESSDSSLIVFCRAWKTPHDLAAYAQDGILLLSIYVKDAAKLSGTGMLELSSAGGTSSWKLPALTTGWNHVEINVADYASEQADLSAITSFRVYHYVSGDNTIGIDGMRITMKEGSTSRSDWAFGLDQDGKLVFNSAQLTYTAPETPALNDGKWHHILLRYDGKTLSFYVDGEKVASTPAEGALTGSSSAADLYIGAASESKGNWTGSIADVIICDAAKVPSDMSE